MTETELQEYFSNDFTTMADFESTVMAYIFADHYEKGLTHKSLVQSGDYSPKANDCIKDILQCGTIFSLDATDYGYLYEVVLADKTNVSRSRVNIMRAVKSLLETYTHTLVVFHYENTKDSEWRFSYMHKGSSQKDSTQVKRYTYLCGKGHPSHTVAKNFITLKNSNFSDNAYLEAFSVEALTKEFFGELFKWYESACNLAEFPSANCVGKYAELTKENNNLQLIRLITRLMFVWFIKHKDLVPAWIFDKNQLNSILSKPMLNSEKDGNYYNAVLQNLFFGALNKKISERAFANNSDHDGADSYYGIKTYYRDNNKDSFFTLSHEEMIEKFRAVPFLNGGLFECLDWDEISENGKTHTVHYIDGFSREPRRRAFVPNSLFWSEDEKQLGLIPLLGRYNFTVEESSPNDVQVALDPELLGKVFENLLGTYNPETQETARKDSGSFYTPREIVSFMVEQSLLDYLHTGAPNISETELKKLFDENALLNFENIHLSPEQINAVRTALFEIKIIDPACGSGAFPMGILNQLVELHTILDKISAQKDEQNTLPIKKGQCINYAPSGSDLNIKAEYIGDQMFTLKLNGKLQKTLYNSQDLALYVKEVINEYNKSQNKKTIANLFSQGRIDDGLSFNSIKSKQEIRQIVDADTKEIIWQYKTYNVENKFRSYRNAEADAAVSEKVLNNDYEYAKYLYSLKKEIIQNSIYGVDIQPIAVQICKLRFFISLICEQPKNDDEEDNYGYNPLPNLETKFVAADTLTGLQEDEKDLLDYTDATISKLKEELIVVRGNHFKADNAHDKIENRKRDEELRKEIIAYLQKNAHKVDKKKIASLKDKLATIQEKINALPVELISVGGESANLFGEMENNALSYDKNGEKRKALKNEAKNLQKEIALEENKSKNIKSVASLEELVKWNPYDQNATSSFFDADWMYGVKDGFDIVIGNPPYVQLQKDDGRLAKRYDGKGYETCTKMGDIYCLFYEKGYNLLSEKGRLCFITSNKWMRAGYGEKLREFFANKVNPKRLVDFAGVKVFESATVDTNILLFEKGKNAGKTQSCIATALTKAGLANLSDFVRQESSISNFGTSNSWVILSPIEQSIKAKIEKLGTPLRDWNINIYRGVLTGFNDAFIISGEKRQEILDNCKTEAERKRTDELIRPILRGRDIKRYSYSWADLWLIYIPWHFPLHFDQTIQGASEKAEKEFKKQYPAIYTHLLGYKKELSARNKAETGIRYEWYAMQRWGANYWDEFNKPKIVWGNLNLSATYTLAPAGMMINAPATMIVPASENLLCVLNSKLADYYIRNLGVTRNGGYFEYKPMFIEQLPVPKNIDENLFSEFTGKELHNEKEIDRKVYELYGLTDTEIQFLEKM